LIVSFITGNGHLQMHGEAAIALLRLMGHSGTVPGAILAAELPAALAALRQGLQTSGDAIVPAPPPRPADEQDEDDVHKPSIESVRLRTRAVPLIELLERAIAAGTDLMWERA
jgi:Domain of unknown function (DUF1840)